MIPRFARYSDGKADGVPKLCQRESQNSIKSCLQARSKRSLAPGNQKVIGEMRQFLLRYKKDDLAHFGVYVTIFVLTFIWVWGWAFSILAGTVFGAAVMLTHGLLRKPVASIKKELIVITPPKLIAYLLAVCFHFFALVTALASWSRFEERHTMAIACFVFSALVVGCAYSLATQFVIGKSFLIVRRRFFGFGRERVFRLTDVESASVGRFKGLELKFRDGQKINVQCHEPGELNHLPECKNPPKLKAFDLLYRLKEEIERCMATRDLVSESSEKAAIGNTPFNVMGAKGFVVTGVIVVVSFLGMTYQNHLRYAHRIINMSDQQTLRYNDVSFGFAIFRGKEFQHLEVTWNQKCYINSDYNCRLASYLETIKGDNARALELVKQSCSDRDPHSCYNVYSDNHVDAVDKIAAASVLDRVCQQENFKNQTCCTCYAEAKVAHDMNGFTWY